MAWGGMRMLEPKERVVMISGADQGIGLAVALVLAARGSSLSPGARDEAALADATADLPARPTHGSRGEAADARITARPAAYTAHRFDRMKTVVANARLEHGTGVEDADESAYDAMRKVHSEGSSPIVCAPIPHVRRARAGPPVVIDLLFGKRMLPDSPGDPASTCAAVALARSASGDGCRDGLRAAAGRSLMPDTAMIARQAGPPDVSRLPPEVSAETVRRAVALPNDASVAGILLNSRREAMF